MLFELGTEELPPDFFHTPQKVFTQDVEARLDQAQLAHGALHPYASARRLALIIEAVAARTPDQQQTRKGPSLDRAYDANGQPTAALLGFAKSCGVDAEALEQQTTEQGTWLIHQAPIPGRACEEILPDLLNEALGKLPLSRAMRWTHKDTRFARPVRWVVLQYNTQVIETEILGVASGLTTRGHRFLEPEPFVIGPPENYLKRLKKGHVIAEAAAFDRRYQEEIRSAEQRLNVTVATHTGRAEDSAEIKGRFLNVLRASIEYPTAISGQFQGRFLELPDEVLVSVLEEQSLFATVDPKGQRTTHFIALSNLPKDPQGRIRAGYERVINARLEDALFYFEQDRRRTLDSRVEDLERVRFHRKLGTLAERSRRLQRLARCTADLTGADAPTVHRAAHLCKADLGTDLVQSFPKLQGLMGAHYARHDGEPEAVCQAIREHYRPTDSRDRLPDSTAAQALSLADRLDWLTGAFCVGEIPTGSRDPLGVRRAAYGILQLILHPHRRTDLTALIHCALQNYPEAAADTDTAIREYLVNRLREYAHSEHQAKDTIEAILATDVPDLTDAMARIEAVGIFRDQPQATGLIEANKRIKNILKATEELEDQPDAKVLVEPAEQRLLQAWQARDPQVQKLCATGQHEAAFKILLQLAEPVAEFFDAVLVMAEDVDLRHNRLCLLKKIRQSFLRIADLSRLQ